jgi:formylmethanofuran dehydrogenase subunit E
MKDASLDEFVGASEQADGSQTGETSAGGDTEAVEATTDNESVQRPERGSEPAVATARWEPSGKACKQCGETVSRLWNEHGEFVCRLCREW